MKLLVVLSLFTFALSCMAETTTAKKNLPINKTEKFVKEEQKKVKVESQAEADCDKKAMQPIEIKPESISLSGNAGCSLDDVKH